MRYMCDTGRLRGESSLRTSLCGRRPRRALLTGQTDGWTRTAARRARLLNNHFGQRCLSWARAAVCVCVCLGIWRWGQGGVSLLPQNEGPVTLPCQTHRL